MDRIGLAAVSFCAFFWAAVCLFQAIGSRVTLRLRDVPLPGEGMGDPPLVAAIVPALNEEAAVRPALESLLRQDYPSLLVIPVNDRSTDRTGEILEEVAAGDSRVNPLHVRDLPAGWLGKNHANWLGWRRAREMGAEWLLFTDGDVRFSRDALARALAFCRREGLDHLTVIPELVKGGFWESVFMTSFTLWFGVRYQPWLVGRPGSRRFLGVGAFNLVRWEAYEAIGTHAALRLTVADDMALGKLLQRAGLRQRALDGVGQVSVRWQEGLGASVRGLYKNSFPSMGFSLPTTAAVTAFVLVTNVWPWAAPWVLTGGSRLLGAAALLLLCAAFHARGRALGYPRTTSLGIALMSWLAGLLLAWAMLASGLVATRQRGITWRGTFYPLEELRGAQVKL